MNRLTGPKMNAIDNESLMPMNSGLNSDLNSETNFYRRIPTKIRCFALSMIWIATSFLTFAIGYHIKDNHCSNECNDCSNGSL